jgi:hypothetical protein
VFQTRFVMSYLAGPLTRTQIQKLMAAAKKEQAHAAPAPAPAATATVAVPAPVAAPSSAPGVAPAPASPGGARPVAPGSIEERFASGTALGPALLGLVKVHYVQARAKVDLWRELTVVAALDAGTAGDFWEHAVVVDPARLAGLEPEPDAGATFVGLPRALDAKAVGKLDDGLAAWAYRAAKLTLWTAPALGLTSIPGELEAEFRARVALNAREARDAAVDKLRAKYRPRLEAIAGKQRTAEQRVDREQSQATSATADSAIRIGASVLGALFGGRRASATKVSSAARSMSRTAGQRGDVTRAKDALDQLAVQHAELEAELDHDIAEVSRAPEPVVETVELEARKADTAVTRVALLWLPA